MNNVGNNSPCRSQGVPNIFMAPMCKAHCAVIFAITQLSCCLRRGSSVNFWGKHFCLKICVWKINKMPIFYMIFALLVLSLIYYYFFLREVLLPPLLRQWILCATTRRPLFYLRLRFEPPCTKCWRRHFKQQLVSTASDLESGIEHPWLSLSLLGRRRYWN